MSARGADHRVPRRLGLHGGRFAGGLVAELLQTAALLVVVAAAASLMARWLDPSKPARPDAVVRFARGPAAVRGAVVLLAGTPGEVRIALDARSVGGHGHPTGAVTLSGETFVAHGRVRCLRTSSTAAVVGVTGTTVYRRTGRREARSGVVVLALRPQPASATYALDRGQVAPDCASPSSGDLLAASGRLVITRR